VLTNALILRGHQSGRRNLIELWLEANPGKSLFVFRAAPKLSLLLKRDSDDFISVQWVSHGEVFQTERQPHIISYDEAADFSDDMWTKLRESGILC
jgi:hypothetical protein